MKIWKRTPIQNVISTLSDSIELLLLRGQTVISGLFFRWGVTVLFWHVCVWFLISLSVYGHHVCVSPVCPRHGRVHRSSRLQCQSEERPRPGPRVRPLQTRARHRELPLLPVPGRSVSNKQRLFNACMLHRVIVPETAGYLHPNDKNSQVLSKLVF